MATCQKGFLMVARYKPILAIGSATGGAGKSLFATSLASAIADKGKQVVLADLAWGAPVIHQAMGGMGVEYSLRQYIRDKFCNLHSILNATPISGVRLLTHQGDEFGWQPLTYAQKQRLFRSMHALNCDALILDLHTGGSPESLDYMVFAPQVLWITDHTMASKEGLCQLARNLAFRRLHQLCKANHHIQDFVEDAFSPRSPLQMASIPELLKQIATLDAEAAASFKEWQSSLCIWLISNHSDSNIEDWQDWIDLTSAMTGFVFKWLGSLPSLAQLDTKQSPLATMCWTEQRPIQLNSLLENLISHMYISQ